MRGSKGRALPGAALHVLAVVVVFSAVGALAGVVWEWLWTPPSGIVVSGTWGLDSGGITEEFSGTGWYVVVASACGLLTGVLTGYLTPRCEVLVVAAVVVGSFVAGWVMFQVGHHLGPPDPQLLAAGRADGARLPSDLTLSEVGDDPGLFRLRTSASAAFPAGALVGLATVLLTTRGRVPTTEG